VFVHNCELKGSSDWTGCWLEKILENHCHYFGLLYLYIFVEFIVSVKYVVVYKMLLLEQDIWHMEKS
jgi:hypothetical protein